ncbi:MAG: hypothetical protein IKP68_10390, partial [Clostridia bacterium]|nr:hypothetical protein [Clostridia bacterium]
FGVGIGGGPVVALGEIQREAAREVHAAGEVDGVEMLVLEIGYDEAKDVTDILAAHGFTSRVTKDYGGNDRCVTATKD